MPNSLEGKFKSNMAKLVLVRHGESEWNKIGLWTGWVDVKITKQGEKDAASAGSWIKDIHFDKAYTSKLIRAHQTLEIILKVINQSFIPIIEDINLNERHYGIYIGKNKWEAKETLGEEKFQNMRRSWDFPIEDGETMKDVYERVTPYFNEEILPNLKKGENILVSAHGNSLRALVKYLDNLSEEQVANLEFGIGEVYVYEIDSKGKVTHKEIRNKNPLAGKQ